MIRYRATAERSIGNANRRQVYRSRCTNGRWILCRDIRPRESINGDTSRRTSPAFIEYGQANRSSGHAPIDGQGRIRHRSDNASSTGKAPTIGTRTHSCAVDHPGLVFTDHGSSIDRRCRWRTGIDIYRYGVNAILRSGNGHGIIRRYHRRSNGSLAKGIIQ